ncbi:MAG TPA: hypothetical protein VNA69_14160 [Thermoanaerobaculia bacterium]|nr:hypothetical protein [Thermoanaerobaculia bacterium]
MNDWPHAPLHRFQEAGVYFITAATYLKQHFFRTRDALDALRNSLFVEAAKHECWLQAWALFANHYHLIVSCADGERVRQMLVQLHKDSAIDMNRADGAKGRRVWFQFWDVLLTNERSWLVRLRYTHENAVHHRLVERATNYPWCSASWFERSAPGSFVKTVGRMKIDRVKVYDDFAEVMLPQ